MINGSRLQKNNELPPSNCAYKIRVKVTKIEGLFVDVVNIKFIATVIKQEDGFYENIMC